MKAIRETIAALNAGAADGQLTALYPGGETGSCRQRLIDTIGAFREVFGERNAISLFSAPGRTELGGNHTDHQGGHVLAGSVDLDILAVAAPRHDGLIRVQSEGFPMDCIDLSDTSVHPEETDTSAALLRGIAARFGELGHPVTGFDAYTVSCVPKGSGLSSSAAFEVLIGNICSSFFARGTVDAVQIARIGQYAENVYFGKPCGLMDQMACSVGGVIAIDFKGADPVYVQRHMELAQEGYALCILDSGADHADLTHAYAAIPAEMGSVARALGVQRLCETSREALLADLPRIRACCGDRAVLRALHFFGDDARVTRQADALEKGDLESFLQLVQESGRSSFQYLQNVSVYADPHAQEAALTIGVCETLLEGRGAVRIHGGGFAGTVQAYVPLDMLADFMEKTDRCLGKDRCHVLHIRDVGGVQIHI